MILEPKKPCWRYLKVQAPDGTKRLRTPFTIVIDTREQAPWWFLEVRADANQGRQRVEVLTTRHSLSSGDYSISGMESRVAVERKSLVDLYGTLSQGRRRFQNELARLSDLDFAAVVVEADWQTVLGAPPAHSRLNPKTVFRSIIAWRVRYPKVHWEMCPGRAFAEVVTFRLLERFWREQQHKDLR